MYTPSVLALALATFAAATPTLQARDKPLDFVISIFETSLTCDASLGAKSVFGTGCVNRTLPMGGSALVRISTASPNGFVTGYSGADCTGDVVVVFSRADGCMDFDDVEVRSWIGKAPFSEEPTK